MDAYITTDVIASFLLFNKKLTTGAIKSKANKQTPIRWDIEHADPYPQLTITHKYEKNEFLILIQRVMLSSNLSLRGAKRRGNLILNAFL